MKVLLVNACYHKETSRTEVLTRALISLLKEKGAEVEVLDLNKENLLPLSEEELDRRQRLIADNDFSDPIFKYPNQFKEADVVVVSAPYWDFSFPATLKIYIEYLSAMNILYTYDSEGISHGLSKVKSLYYVSTAGGDVANENYGFFEWEALGKRFGVEKVIPLMVMGTDIVGNDVKGMLEDKISALASLI